MQDNAKKLEYIRLMTNIKELNQQYINSVYRSLSFRIRQIKEDLKHARFAHLFASALNFIKPRKRNADIIQTPNYFCDDKIAIYTCILGDYDKLRNPFMVPDNCDFYVISDHPYESTIWKYINIVDATNGLKMNNRDLNRFVKFHPDKIFPEYKYSIYVDGNIKVMTDLTEYVNMLGEIGVATFKHPMNDCAYKEAQNCASWKKLSRQDAKKHVDYMHRNNMPKKFGLADCGMIVREHFNRNSILLMDLWWNQYLEHSKRDQISFAYSVFRLGFNMKDITVLGNNMYKAFSVQRFPHYWNDVDL